MVEDHKNYIQKAFVFTIWVIVFLAVIRTVPPFTLFGMDFKRADILSDVVYKPKAIIPEPDIPDLPDDFLPDDAESDPVLRSDSSLKEGVPDASAVVLPVEPVMPDSAVAGTVPAADSLLSVPVQIVSREIKRNRPRIAIEDYTEEGDAVMRLRRSLIDKKQVPARIAFMGDSFMEGDILTGDIREMLQAAVGGRGVGFVPIASIVASLRQTVSHEFSGWESFSIKKKNDSLIDRKFMLSGYIYTPHDEGATLHYRTTRFKKYLTDITRASFVFSNPGHTKIEATVNDSVRYDFTPDSSPDIQRILLTDMGRINSLSFRFTDTEGFMAYGVLMDSDKGIAVDNYADRGSSGLQFYKLKKGYNAGYNDFCDYDMIVLEFGINVVAKGMIDYSWFERQMITVVKNIRNCYPTADIVIMGVSDRSTKEEGEYVTMPEIKSMIATQRAIAQKCKVAFFDTYGAMGGENSMVKFVERGWAAKDYTHVSSAGAKVIAREFVDALLDKLEPVIE